MEDLRPPEQLVERSRDSIAGQLAEELGATGAAVQMGIAGQKAANPHMLRMQKKKAEREAAEAARAAAIAAGEPDPGPPPESPKQELDMEWLNQGVAGKGDARQ